MPDARLLQPASVEFEEFLLERGALDGSAYERAARLQAESGEALSAILTKLGLVPELALAEAYAAYLELPIIAVEDFPETAVLSDRLSSQFLRRTRIIPVSDTPRSVVVAMADPLDDESAEALQFALGKAVVRRVALPSDIEAAYERLYGDRRESPEADDAAEGDGTTEDIERLKDLASDAPVIRLVNQLIDRAVEARASDIHVEPSARGIRVRYRIDGVLHEVNPSPPSHLRAAIISRIKIMAKLNIAERRLAQDGRIRLPIRGREIDLRVATSPTLHGESVVLRILDRRGLDLELSTLGFDEGLIEAYRGLLQRPHGILLSTGPTGSGKTTTLYTSLAILNTPDKKILTIEDPIEYQLEGVNQHQVKPQIGLTFASALRSFLRQDPDIMMVGEIRDLETAQIAVQAALTGHLILATLHTNDAASGITRLLDMGIEDYLLTSTVNGLLGQRLVRRLCERCRERYAPSAELIERLQLSDGEVGLYRGVGCAQCGGTGFHGRTMIVELLPVTDSIRQLILDRAEAREIQKAACSDGMRTMYQHGLVKALAGLTTIEEVMRVTQDA